MNINHYATHNVHRRKYHVEVGNILFNIFQKLSFIFTTRKPANSHSEYDFPTIHTQSLISPKSIKRNKNNVLPTLTTRYNDVRARVCVNDYTYPHTHTHTPIYIGVYIYVVLLCYTTNIMPKFYGRIRTKDGRWERAVCGRIARVR